MQVVFMGSPNFSLPSLRVLSSLSSCDICAVFCRAPKPKGRGMKIGLSPVHDYAINKNIPVFTPVHFNDISDLVTLKPDLIVCVAYGIILPDSVLSLPTYGCINVHPSLLPAYRGATPIASAIISGCDKTGVSIMLMDKGMDTGNVISMQEMVIEDNDNLMTMEQKLADKGAGMLARVVEDISRNGGKIDSTAQSEDGISYCRKILDYGINWNLDARSVNFFIRGSYPKAYTMVGGKRLRILEAVSHKGGGKKSGEFFDSRNVGCADNSYIELKIVQLEGCKVCSIDDFLRGRSLTNE